ncbi:hypothetical protein TIFTF001_009311 [Ficus carica]|uniref:Uncharacterized protein n=1 Tax=Ficus carica TaxID=3494 RepID=A0AA88D2H1_FICCA|nr:hypothetical protein TIFTF001_009311 [Ficus carica]
MKPTEKKGFAVARLEQGDNIIHLLSCNFTICDIVPLIDPGASLRFTGGLKPPQQYHTHSSSFLTLLSSSFTPLTCARLGTSPRGPWTY